MSTLAGCQKATKNDVDDAGQSASQGGGAAEQIAKFGYQVEESFDTSINYIAGSWVTFGVVETLFSIDHNGKVEPWLAESCEMADDLHWTLKLKKNIKFHDGTPFNADAVIFTVSRINDPGQYGGNYDFISSIDKVDDYTLNITTTKPYSALKERFCEYKTSIVSPTNSFENTLIGTGPFKFKENIKGVKTVVERNGDYWGGAVKLAGAEFYPSEDEMTRTYSLYNHEIDFSILNLPITEYSTAKSHKELDVFTSNCQYTHVMIMNTTKAPFDDVNVRHAFSYAIDREALVKGIYGEVEGGLPSYGIATEGSPWYNKSMPKLGYDKDKALELFKNAGIEDSNGDGMLDYKGKPFTITIMTYETGLYKHAVEILQAQLNSIGIKTALEITTWDVTDQKMSNKDYDINFDSSPFFEFGSPNSLENNFGSSSYFALGAGYASDKIDSLLSDASREVNEAARKEKYDAVQAIAVEDLPMIPVFEVVKIYGMNKRLHEMDLNSYTVFKITKDTYIAD